MNGAAVSRVGVRAVEGRNVALVDLLDRLLGGGVVVAGEITLGIADVDLVRISLRALLASVRTACPNPDPAPDPSAETCSREAG